MAHKEEESEMEALVAEKAVARSDVSACMSVVTRDECGSITVALTVTSEVAETSAAACVGSQRVKGR